MLVLPPPPQETKGVFVVVTKIQEYSDNTVSIPSGCGVNITLVPEKEGEGERVGEKQESEKQLASGPLCCHPS